MHYVYILKNLAGRYYIGQTTDIRRRIEEHNHGKTKSIRSRGPFKLIYKESFDTRAEAIKRERQIKKYKGGNAFKRLIGMPM